MERYSVTVYVAAPGTPLKNTETGALGTPSVPGHMYYAVSNGSAPESFGFAPIDEGSIRGGRER